MRPYEVGMFKKFLQINGLDSLFRSSYKSHKWTLNPKSIEEFLYSVNAEEVCLRAFYFYAGTKFGYDYWLDKQEKWNEYRKSNYDPEHAENWVKLRGNFRSMLTQDWDSQKWWKHNNKAVAKKRILGIFENLGIPYVTDDVVAGIVDDEDEDEEEVASELNTVTKTAHDDDEEDVTEDFLAGFVLMDVDGKKQGQRTLKENEASVNTRNNQGKITFSRAVSEEAKKRGGYRCAALMRGKNGEIVIVFNDKSGIDISNGWVERKNTNLTVGSKDMTLKVHGMLGLQSDYSIVNVKKLGKTDDYVAYQLIAKDNKVKF